jgi:PAS domain S-box-containing protein
MRGSDSQSDLADSQEIFRLLVDAVEDYAIFALDPTGIISTWNLGAERLKGYTSGEVIGSHFSRFYTASDIERHHPEFELKQAAEIGKYEEEGWRVRKDGSKFWANVVITAMRDKRGALVGYSKVTRNLTERKIAEDQLKEAYAQLEHRIEERTKELSIAKAKAESAVKARDEFFSIASHELKTPLSSLKLQVQMRKRNVLKGNLSDFAPDKLLELCEDDEKQVARLDFLVENMMDISKLTSGIFSLSLETFDLVELTQDIVKRMEAALLETGNRCTIHSPKSIVGVWDRHRLEQVISNLLSNASKYAPGKPVELTLTSDSKEVTLKCRDEGRGISKKDQERIFVPFERVDDDGGTSGLGLGLYIVRQICEAHRGNIRVDSEVGQGTLFEVTLPIEAKSSSRSR